MEMLHNVVWRYEILMILIIENKSYLRAGEYYKLKLTLVISLSCSKHSIFERYGLEPRSMTTSLRTLNTFPGVVLPL